MALTSVGSALRPLCFQQIGVWVRDDVPPGLGLLVEVGDLGSTLGLDITLARKLGQVRPLLGGVVIGLLAGCVGAVPRSALIAGDAQRRSGRRCA
ncbi:MAG: hypothetical protein ACLP3C_17205, partial [Mycobacterium sp.]|uniref:hypothetical protein n=1 Tax=Mycobacterium sp. TaxID=1785 RepID=UPI003F9CFF84